MAWLIAALLLAFLLDVVLIGLVISQIMSLTDLEYDYVNPYDSSSYINRLIIPEFLIHGGLCILSLLTGSWLMLLLCIPFLYYHMKWYTAGRHLVDVTEIFSLLSHEKNFRLLKLVYYLLLFIVILYRLVMTVLDEES